MLLLKRPSKRIWTDPCSSIIMEEITSEIVWQASGYAEETWMEWHCGRRSGVCLAASNTCLLAYSRHISLPQRIHYGYLISIIVKYQWSEDFRAPYGYSILGLSLERYLSERSGVEPLSYFNLFVEFAIVSLSDLYLSTSE